MITNIDRDAIEDALRNQATTWQEVVSLSGWAAKGLQQWARDMAPDLLPVIAAKKAAHSEGLCRSSMDALLPLANQAADAAQLDPKVPIGVNAQAIIAAAMKATGKTKLRYGMLCALAQVMAERGCVAPTPASMRWHKLEIVNNPAKFGIKGCETTVPVG